MKRSISLLVLSLFFTTSLQAQARSDSATVRSIYSEMLSNGKAYDWLRVLSNDIGGRLSGSPEAQQAVEYTRKAMLEAGADTVWLQEIWVPHWVRGAKESGRIIARTGDSQEVPVCALGGSVATPKEGISGNVVEVHDFDELKTLGREKIEGKIVFYNHPFDPTFINTFEAYGEAGKYRWSGPSEAARYGAIASIVRSMTLAQDDFPHTGAMGYNDSLPKIPCAAISTNGANLLSNILRADPGARFLLRMDCQLLDSVLSHNVIGEIRGRELPDEVLVVGGHLDSWDTGDGAHDDGAGVMQSVEILRTFKALKLRPKRTIRAIAFMNEENGLRGGRGYAAWASTNSREKHVMAIESDAGGFTPYGFGLDMPEDKKPSIRKYRELFRPYNVWNFEEEHGGADISPLKPSLKVPLVGLVVDSQRYFDYHHAGSDTFDKVNKRELLLGAAAMGSLLYLVSENGF